MRLDRTMICTLKGPPCGQPAGVFPWGAPPLSGAEAPTESGLRMITQESGAV